MLNLAQPSCDGTVLRKSGLQAKLWPNGELSLHYPKKLKIERLQGAQRQPDDTLNACLIRAYGVAGALEARERMGLSNVCNFDKKKNLPSRYGLKGITSKGRRIVRNACYLLEKEVDRRFLTFATVTLPELPYEQMIAVHASWHKVVEAYRREIRRELINHGLSGEMIGVSEIQPKRWEKTGMPVLHCHFVWHGRKRGENWAIATSKHDEIWKRAVKTVIADLDADFSSAANLQPVRKSAENYLSKYMSKGGAAIAEVVSSGLSDLLPRQWWSCSRALSRRIAKQLRIFSQGTQWLLERANMVDGDFFDYFVNIEVPGKTGELINVGYYGKLSSTANALVRQVLSLSTPTAQVA
jgi:hypothetical protein